MATIFTLKKAVQPYYLYMVIDILKNQEQGSVGQRFCLAILYKMSSLKDVIYYYHDKKLHLQMIDIIRNAQDNKTHNFCLDYASSILGNIVCEKFILESYVQDQKEAIKIMKAILELPSSKFGCGVNKNILFILAQFKSSQKECDFNL
ncbi:hypothetical protein PPERSA_06002 [Pseudocohnilembus persalinus]|uniref:Armadillo-type fold n=1 Tax=Pseudocohnilembus persalinus TaxID=266149 RepID=A0A0V0Q7H3_PSEPJ|nr:hypothetical protein PPERSA_06002 [Pseudocohnilembus persalinus]|eukprot:KRW98106.1 hypothetical protein PPERSA_06002 [Pseudocohnilembus persalinus]